MSRILLGVDGGGTKSHALVADESGEVLGFGVSGAANWENVGIEATGAALRAAVGGALSAAGVKPEDVSTGVFGLAGVDFPIDESRLSGIPLALGLAGPCHILNDSFVALRAGANRPWGVVVIAGTGSVVAGRNPDGEVFRTLGQGPLFGDTGSMSEVSEQGVTAVAEAHIGKGPKTALSEMLCEHTGQTSVLDFLEAVARGRIDGATFTPVVVDAAERGDSVARRILEDAGTAMGELACLVALELRMEQLDFELVLSGGMFRQPSRIVPSALEAAVRRVAPAARVVRLEAPPVVGAALLAMELAEIPIYADLHSRLALGAISALQVRSP